MYLGAVAFCFGLVFALVRACRAGDEEASAPPARPAATRVADSAAAPETRVAAPHAPAAAPVPAPGPSSEQAPDGDGPESTVQETPEPAAREAAAYPWEEFEDVLGRELTASERDALRDLRKEHGLRLAETHARMQRGELEQSEYDTWRAARAAQFRAEIEKALDCSADQVAALLRVPMRSAAVP
jgi:hypothetical protein